MERGEVKPSFSIPSIIAAAAAIGSLFVGAMGGIILAVVAVIFGVIGLIMSFSPSVRGGMVSILSLVLAGFGVIVALFKGIAALL